MAKRIFELAKEYGVKSKEIIDFLVTKKVVVNNFSRVDDRITDIVRKEFDKNRNVMNEIISNTGEEERRVEKFECNYNTLFITDNNQTLDAINNYRSFCKAFQSSPEESRRAVLLLVIQDWIIRKIDKIDKENTDYTLDTLLVDNIDKSYLRAEKMKDVLSKLTDDSYDAIRRIAENMRENIIRENVKLPVHKVREINSYGLIWLSRRSGRTIKEKISSANSSMMAVQRRMSLDAGENRLFIAYLKELAEYFQIKFELYPREKQSEIESQFYSLLLSIIRNPDMEEIRRWENLPPNNTLLSDQNYKKIWKGWNELKQIDDLIANDDKNISHRICTIFYIEFLTKASQYIIFPQVPIVVSYEEYSVTSCSNIFYGIDINGQVLRVKREEDSLYINYDGHSIELKFVNTSLLFFVNGQYEKTVSITTATLNICVDLVLSKLVCKAQKNPYSRRSITLEKYKSVVMDLFSLRPSYKGDEKEIQALSGRLLRQVHVYTNGEENHCFDIACDQANAILVNETIKTYNVPLAVENASATQMSKLMHLLERYVSAQKFTFLFPDIYTEFQLSLVYKSARLAFHEVRSFPRSIGISFLYLKTELSTKKFHKNEFLLVSDLVDDVISFTLIQGVKDDVVAHDIPEYSGIILERHPSSSYSVKNQIKKQMEELLTYDYLDQDLTYKILGIDGFSSEQNKFALLYGRENALALTNNLCKSISSIRLNINDIVEDFLINHKGIIGNKKIHIISLARQLSYNGNLDFTYFERQKVLEGFSVYESLQRKTKSILWRDHLPELSIKLLCGKFTLVDKETITPEFNVVKKIIINNTFTLPKNMSIYRFNLVQNDANRNVRYAAVVKNTAFPINHDVECKLEMTYQYGSDEPYKLLFLPKGNNDGFVEAKVIWEKVTEYPCDGMIYPDTPQDSTWIAMRTFPTRQGTEDIIKVLENRFEAFSKGICTFSLSKYKGPISGDIGKRRFTIQSIIEGKKAKIVFDESAVDDKKSGKKISFDTADAISFDLNETLNKKQYQRHTIDLSLYFGPKQSIWRYSNLGYACYLTLNIEGKMLKIAFYENQFDYPEDFTPGIKKISFEIIPYKGDMFKAVKIHDETTGKPYEEIKTYFASNLRKGVKPGQYLYNGWMYFIMLSTFVGKKTLHDKDCPLSLQNAFATAKEPWIKTFLNCDDNFIKMRLFNLMSLIADDFGDKYYKIANKYISNYLKGIDKLPDYIGYAIGDCTNMNQKQLLDSIFQLKDEKVVCILSKTIWGNENYIWNVSIEKSLYYFEAAIKYLKELCDNNYRKPKDITMCLEYILGVYRLRKYNNHDLNLKLSLNNWLVQVLYETVERIVDKKIEIKSFLKLEISNKGVYEQIPDLLYAILLYLTGERGAGDIRISGLDFKDIEIGEGKGGY